MGEVRYEIDRGVVTLTLDRPDKRNALDEALIRSLAKALKRVGADTNARAVVLTGAGPVFCAGLDLRAVDSGELDLRLIGRADASPWALLHGCPKPTVAAVNGPAVTGGLELALSTDLCIASRTAWFKDTHARVGLHPGGGLTVLLPRYIGLRRALAMSLTSEVVTADQAFAYGLVTEVVDSDVVARAQRIARGLADVDPSVWIEMRASFHANTGEAAAAGAAERNRFVSLIGTSPKSDFKNDRTRE